jgi:hypothetical protein
MKTMTRASITLCLIVAFVMLTTGTVAAALMYFNDIDGNGAGVQNDLTGVQVSPTVETVSSLMTITISAPLIGDAGLKAIGAAIAIAGTGISDSGL